VSDNGPQTVTPERQTAAANVATVFNSVHNFLNSLQHVRDDGTRMTTVALDAARIRIEEASFWAVKHVLAVGIPAAPPAVAPSDTPAPLGEVDPPQAPLPTDNATGTESV
jgi:hypothetical protein